MRFHIQNGISPDQFDVTEAQWLQAGGAAHQVSFGRGADAFAAGCAEAEAIIVSTGVLAGLLPLRAPKLRYIFITAAGADRLAPFDWLPDGVKLINNRGTHGPKVAEFAAMALVMLSVRMPRYVQAQREERWAPVFTPTLEGRHAVIIGTGDLGSAAAREARRFGMRVTGVRTRAAPHPDFDAVVAVEELDSVLPEAEFLVLACPLTPQTEGLMSRRRLERLPAGASLLNIGRGPLLDQDALCDLLDSEHLAGAILDVTTPEPPPSGHRVWHTRHLILTPHCSADSPLTYNRDSLAIFMANLRAIDAGKAPPNLVDTRRGY